MHCFSQSVWEGVAHGKIKTSSFIVQHSWAVWSLSLRVIGVYTACGIWAWVSPPHAQSPAWGHRSPPSWILLIFGVLLWHSHCLQAGEMRTWWRLEKEDVLYCLLSDAPQWLGTQLEYGSFLHVLSALPHSTASQIIAGFWFKSPTRVCFPYQISMDCTCLLQVIMTSPTYEH